MSGPLPTSSTRQPVKPDNLSPSLRPPRHSEPVGTHGVALGSVQNGSHSANKIQHFVGIVVYAKDIAVGCVEGKASGRLSVIRVSSLILAHHASAHKKHRQKHKGGSLRDRPYAKPILISALNLSWSRWHKWSRTPCPQERPT